MEVRKTIFVIEFNFAPARLAERPDEGSEQKAFVKQTHGRRLHPLVDDLGINQRRCRSKVDVIGN